MDEAERSIAYRRLAWRWGTGLGLVLILLAVWRVFVLICPIRDWPVLGWSLGSSAAWNEPQIPALVAENALENGGPVGQWLGQRLYARTLAPAADSPVPGGPQPYSQVHLSSAWLGASGVQWSTKPWTGSGSAVLVSVSVEARLAEAISSAPGCEQTAPVSAVVARDYVVVDTPQGWRVAYIYLRAAGTPLAPVAGLGSGTAAGALGC
ncbi:MAG TPA: hypothetical protein VNM16_03180 [Bacillota bacterium]|nr:hypothetical protein [Bacillota bacterium]